eukprot:3175623-Prymnesium_polylepis.1
MPGSRFLMRDASTTCACLLPDSYWSSVLVSALVITSFERSILLSSKLPRGVTMGSRWGHVGSHLSLIHISEPTRRS